MNRAICRKILALANRALKSKEIGADEQKEIRRIIGFDLNDGQPLWEPDTTTSWLVLGGAGSGKTSACTLSSLLSVLSDHERGVVINDIKGECFAQCAALCHRYGRKVAAIDPLNKIDPDNPFRVEINIFDNVIRAYLTGSRTLLLEIMKVVKILIEEPPRPDQNDWFRKVPREFLILAILALLERNPHLLTPSSLAKLISDPDSFEMITDMEAEDGGELIRSRAQRIKALREGDGDSYDKHYLEAVSAVEMWAEGGPLSDETIEFDVTIKELLAQNYIVFIVGDKSTASELKTHYGLTFSNVLSSQLEGGCGRTLLLFDEAAVTPGREIFEKVVLFRSSDLQVIYIAQSRNDLQRRLGDKLLATVEDNTFLQVLQFSSFAEAERYSKIMGEIDNVGYSLNETSNKAGLSSTINLGRERLRPADALLSKPRKNQYIFIAGLPPIECEKAFQNQLGPYANELAPNPEEGNRVMEADIRVHLNTNQGDV